MMDSSPFIFLCRLAYAARYRIPLIIMLLFVVFDIQVQVDINVETRDVPQPAAAPAMGAAVAAFDDDLPASAADEESLEGAFIPLEEFQPFVLEPNEEQTANLEA